MVSIDVWGSTGSTVQDLADPIVLSLAKQVSPVQIFCSISLNNNYRARLDGADSKQSSLSYIFLRMNYALVVLRVNSVLERKPGAAKCVTYAVFSLSGII